MKNIYIYIEIEQDKNVPEFMEFYTDFMENLQEIYGKLPKYNSGSFHNFSRWSYGNFRKGQNMKKINFILVTLIAVFSINLSQDQQEIQRTA